MRIENGRIILGERECVMCEGRGWKNPMSPCPTCKGTGRGIRGGARGCRKCSGIGKLGFDETRRETCGCCNGSGKVAENLCDTINDADWPTFTFKVYRQNRGITFNEAWLGAGCVFSMADYGAAWNANDDAALVAYVKTHTYIQATKIAKDDGEVCDHIGIFVNRGGYSVRPCFRSDALDAAVKALNEPSEAVGMAIGQAVYANGGNGVAAAAGL